VRTLQEWKEILLQEVAEMRGREGNGVLLKLPFSKRKKQPPVNIHFYQAEEDLTAIELFLLKNELEMSEEKWRIYKFAS